MSGTFFCEAPFGPLRRKGTGHLFTGESKDGDSRTAQPGQPAEDSPEDSLQQTQPQSPEQQAQQQLQQAIENMKQAEQELDEAKRDKAIEEQLKAEENLRAAIDRLEKILRQLREEEMQRELARLESRLRKMAQMQGKVLDDTKLLDAIPVSQRDRQVDVRAGNLAFEEKKIVMEDAGFDRSDSADARRVATIEHCAASD